MPFNVTATDEKRVNGVAFLDLHPVNTIEDLLLEAGRPSLTHPTDGSIGNVTLLSKKNNIRLFLAVPHR